MQNPHVKYLKTKKGYFYLFYYEQGDIFCRSFSNNGWTLPQKIAEKTAPIFSLCQYDETAYLLYSGSEGDLHLASSRDFSKWEHRPMMRGPHNTGNTKFFILPTENSFHVIYHLPTESTGVNSLVYTSFREGQWEKPYQIDRFMPMQKTPFLARRLNREHIILYYRTGRNILSAREMLLEPYTMGSVTPLIQTPVPCADLSIVNDSERIHMLYIVRGMFRTQVVYQYKHTSAISTPRIMWEDNHCDNCMAYLQEGKVILMWTVNGQPMRCVSENGGSSFGPAERYTGKFPSRCMKAELIGAEDDTFNSMECYGNGQNGFLPAVYPLPVPSAPQKKQKQPIPQPDHSKAFKALQESHKQQLEELSALLTQRSDEIAAVNARWKAQLEKLETELEALQKENTQLKTKSVALSPETEKDV